MTRVYPDVDSFKYAGVLFGSSVGNCYEIDNAAGIMLFIGGGGEFTKMLTLGQLPVRLLIIYK